MLASPKKPNNTDTLDGDVYNDNHDESEEVEDNDLENGAFSESDSTSPFKPDNTECENSIAENHDDHDPEEPNHSLNEEESEKEEISAAANTHSENEIKSEEFTSPHMVNDVSSHNGDTEAKRYDLSEDTPITEESLLLSKKRLKKLRKKFNLSVKNSLNGLSSKSKKNSAKKEKKSVAAVEQYAEPRTEYAQYLGLKPSVNFKCSRCGRRNFCTIALLREHMASCNGQLPVTAVTPTVPPLHLHKSETSVTPSYSVNSAANLRITRKVFLCSSCGTYYQSYNLYVHMRDVHNKQICLVCLSMFCGSQQLFDHLVNVHNVRLGEYTTASQIRNTYKDSFYITCCTCNRIFSDNERFDEHVCDNGVQTSQDEEPTQTISQPSPPSEEEPYTPVEDEDKPHSPAVPDLSESSAEEEEPPVVVKPPSERERTPSPVDIPLPEELPSPPPPEPPPEPVAENVPPEEVPSQVEEAESDGDSLNAAFDDSKSEEQQDKVAQPLPMALMLEESVASFSPHDLIRECVKTSCTSCVYCSNAIVIAVHATELINHLLYEHRYLPTKNEDDAEGVVEKLKAGYEELGDTYTNASSLEFDGTFSCFQCAFTTTLLKELCAHKRKAHQIKIFLCIVCKCNFLHYSELLCHQCPGVYSSEVYSLRYRCCFCATHNIPSAFRLMIHLRKVHKACDFCLLRFNDQSELFSHMTKQHKMHHLCYKCNLVYRSRNDINKHLFWKHGTEGILCKRCLQKKWPHAYHFCMPASTYTCEECSRVFSKAVALTVHRRAHTGDFPFSCECNQRFISKKLLSAHQRKAHPVEGDTGEEQTETAEGENTSKTKETADSDSGHSNAEQQRGGGEDGGVEKKRRKKKRKKAKVNEKPLLDELPPLNLSSESEEESAAEEETSKPATESLPPPVVESSPTIEPAKSSPSADTLRDEEEPAQPDETSATDTMANVNEEEEAERRAAMVEAERQAAIAEEERQAAIAEAEKQAAIAEAERKAAEEEKKRAEAALLERMLNCLLVEHSYCIPDAIFHSECTGSDAAHTTMAEGGDSGGGSGGGDASSPLSHSETTYADEQHDRSREKSCCKSITPRKRKRVKSGGDDDSSSSSSSDDSDSSSSSCGSNCSCNRSNSNCSSSSSDSDCSTTPEKATMTKKKKKAKTPTKEVEKVNGGGGAAAAAAAAAAAEESIQEEQSEQYLLLNAQESDLDTDICTTDEDFYEEKPSYIPPPVDKPVDAPPALYNQPLPPSELPSSPVPYDKKKSRSRKDKKKKRKRIKLNLSGRLPPNCGLLPNTGGGGAPRIKNTIFRAIVPKQEEQQLSTSPMTTAAAYIPSHYASTEEKPSLLLQQSLSVSLQNAVHSDSAPLSDTNSGRISKRKRVKNKFYGYSSDEAARESAAFGTPGQQQLHQQQQAPSLPPPPKKRISSSKRTQKARNFIGIRAKQLPPLTKKLSITIPYVPVQRPPQQQQQQQQHQSLRPITFANPYESFRDRLSSSDDSDSTERGHTLVINLPSLKEKQNNNSYRDAAEYSEEEEEESAVSSSGDISPPPPLPRLEVPHPSISFTRSPVKSNEKVYCYCQFPYDEVSEMIACDGPNCKIEWFHFECVGITVPPKGKWYCPNCRKVRDNVSRFI